MNVKLLRGLILHTELTPKYKLKLGERYRLIVFNPSFSDYILLNSDQVRGKSIAGKKELVTKRDVIQAQTTN